MEQVQIRKVFRAERLHVESRRLSFETDRAQLRGNVANKRGPAAIVFLHDQQLLDAAQVLALERRARRVGTGKPQRRNAVKPQRPTIGFPFDENQPLRSPGKVEPPDAIGHQRHGVRPAKLNQTGALLIVCQVKIAALLDQHHVAPFIQVRNPHARLEWQILQSERDEELDRQPTHFSQRRKSYARLRKVYRLGPTRAAGWAPRRWAAGLPPPGLDWPPGC